MGAVVALIDYGAGNLASVRKALAAAGADVFIPVGPRALSAAHGIVVPGVGNFGATAALGPEWRESIAAAAAREVPLLGICLGMQWLFDASEEARHTAGLGAIQGTCTRLPPGQKVPHVGWNTLEVRGRSRLLQGVQSGSYAYFTHSYAAPVTGDAVATTSYGTTFTSVVERGTLFGVQFHPEKSGPAGLRVLQNYVAISARAGQRTSASAGTERAGTAKAAGQH